MSYRKLWEPKSRLHWRVNYECKAAIAAMWLGAGLLLFALIFAFLGVGVSYVAQGWSPTVGRMARVCAAMWGAGLLSFVAALVVALERVEC